MKGPPPVIVALLRMDLHKEGERRIEVFPEDAISMEPAGKTIYSSETPPKHARHVRLAPITKSGRNSCAGHSQTARPETRTRVVPPDTTQGQSSPNCR